MYQPCEYYNLYVQRKTRYGYFLSKKNVDEELLLPYGETDLEFEEGERVRVFTYLDSQNRLVATARTPKIELYRFANLRCVEVSTFGAFMDWGLARDLLIPNAEQNQQVTVDTYHLCYLFLDDQDRPTATTKVESVLDRKNIELHPREEVDIIVWQQTNLGFKVIINDLYEGLIYDNEIFKNVFEGKKMKAYVKKIREDNRIDISLEPIGYRSVLGHTERVLEVLEDHGGFLPLHDKSNPQDIKDQLHMSKKVFKKAIGSLYRERKITIEDGGIRLIK